MNDKLNLDLLLTLGEYNQAMTYLSKVTGMTEVTKKGNEIEFVSFTDI